MQKAKMHTDSITNTGDFWRKKPKSLSFCSTFVKLLLKTLWAKPPFYQCFRILREKGSAFLAQNPEMEHFFDSIQWSISTIMNRTQSA